MMLPQHLAKTHATGEKEGEPIAQFEIGDYKNFVYLILDWAHKKAAIVDPQYDLREPLNCLKKHGFELSSVLLTHTHFDHIAGVPELVRSFPQIPICVHRDDSHRLDYKTMGQAKVQSIRDGDIIWIGALEIKVLHTPGHSAGECTYFLKSSPPYLLTGDTVFIRDCGRTDLESGNNQQMFQSLQRIKTLPTEAIILPGHHYQKECASTVKQELQESPPFQCKSVEELAGLP